MQASLCQTLLLAAVPTASFQETAFIVNDNTERNIRYTTYTDTNLDNIRWPNSHHEDLK